MKNVFLVFCLLASGSSNALVSDWYPFERENGRIFVDVQVAGAPARALLDSGATGMVVSQDFLDDHQVEYELGREYRVIGAHGESTRRDIKKLNLSIFGADVPLRDIGTYAGSAKHQFIIGMPFLKLFILQIDYLNERIRFISHGSLDLETHANVEIEHASDERHLVVQAQVGDERLRLLFDTGATAGLFIDHRFAASRGWFDAFESRSAKAYGVNESIDARRLTLPAIQFGPFVLENVSAISPSDDDTSTNYARDRRRTSKSLRDADDAGYDGILGGDVLDHFIVTLDAKHALLHIAVPESADAESGG